jgi:hypothetical protein
MPFGQAHSRLAASLAPGQKPVGLYSRPWPLTEPAMPSRPFGDDPSRKRRSAAVIGARHIPVGAWHVQYGQRRPGYPPWCRTGRSLIDWCCRSAPKFGPQTPIRTMSAPPTGNNTEPCSGSDRCAAAGSVRTDRFSYPESRRPRFLRPTHFMNRSGRSDSFW